LLKAEPPRETTVPGPCVLVVGPAPRERKGKRGIITISEKEETHT
jgi:hypothetical protein